MHVYPPIMLIPLFQGKFNKARGPNGPEKRQQEPWDSAGTGWKEEDRNNEAFEAYYKVGRILLL